MPHLALHLLGSFQVTLNQEPLVRFDYDKLRALLAYLALEAQTPQRRDALAGLLWSERPEDAARHSLRQALSHLRRLLREDERTSPLRGVTRETVQLSDSSQVWLDVGLFDSLLDACNNHDPLS